MAVQLPCAEQSAKAGALVWACSSEPVRWVVTGSELMLEREGMEARSMPVWAQAEAISNIGISLLLCLSTKGKMNTLGWRLNRS